MKIKSDLDSKFIQLYLTLTFRVSEKINCVSHKLFVSGKRVESLSNRMKHIKDGGCKKIENWWE